MQQDMRDTFVAGLKNAHAMESQALAIMRPQVSRIDSYPEVSQRLQRHITETEGQIDRLEQILDRMDEDKSGLKDTAMSMAGGMAAMGHTAASDEILKNSFANFAFENYEIAAYKSLLVLARDMGEQQAQALLTENLEEEQAMADWLDEHIEAVTTQYSSLRAAGEHAKH